MNSRTPDGLFWASIVAPVASVTIALAGNAALVAVGAGDRHLPFPNLEWFVLGLAMAAAVGGVIAFVAALVFAVPLLLLGAWLRIASPFYFMAVGVLTATGYLVSVTGWTALPARLATAQWAELSAAGAIAGFVYWYRVHGRRLDAASTQPDT
ncbi:MAG TPA: hypothetical protein VF744_19070 [Beijerinckiaceae bacterium]|jgi:hypothetical protein